MNFKYSFVENQKDFTDILPRLKTAEKIGVDLEADSMFHFKEKVCLLQFSLGFENFVLDPLLIPDLSPLGDILADPAIVKIFHGADYDIRSLFRDFSFSINNLFDTELATRFLGYSNSGLNSVLKDRFGISLNKKYQKKDWSKRPLSQEMVAYAVNDIAYLIKLYDILREELLELGRLEWVQEECSLLQEVRFSDLEESPLFLKFRGAGKLDRRGLAILENLLDFRLKIAEKKDRPLFKIIASEALLLLASLKPKSIEEIKKRKILGQSQVKMYGKDIIFNIKKALSLKEKELPFYPKSRMPRISPMVSLRIKALKAWRDELALSLKLDPALLCSKNLLACIAHLNPGAPELLNEIKDMKNWQKNLLGEGIVKVLREDNSL